MCPPTLTFCTVACCIIIACIIGYVRISRDNPTLNEYSLHCLLYKHSEQEQLAHLRKKEEALRKREEYLREKEKQLREEQKQLMDKEKQLREERLKDKDLQLARRRQSPTGMYPAIIIYYLYFESVWVNAA